MIQERQYLIIYCRSMLAK